MKKLALVAFLVFSCLALYVWAADEQVNLSGTWVLDQAKSDPFPQSQTAGNASGVADVSRGGGGGRGFGGGSMGGGLGMPGGGGGFGPGRRGAGPSKAGPPAPLVIEQKGSEVTIRNGFMVETLTCDGKQREKENLIPDSDIKLKEKTKAAFKKGKLVVERINYSPPPMGGQQMQTLTKRTYSLSQDGKTLNLVTTTANTMNSMIQKQVYHRQEAAPQ